MPFDAAKWAGRTFQDTATGETLTIPDDVREKQFFQFGDSFIDVGNGEYSRAGGAFIEISVDDADICPACGKSLPEVSGRAACLCPHCGIRCCEGVV